MFGSPQWDRFVIWCNLKLIFRSSVLDLICNTKLIPFRRFSIQPSFSLFSHFTISFLFRLQLLTLSNTPLILIYLDYIPYPNSLLMFWPCVVKVNIYKTNPWASLDPEIFGFEVYSHFSFHHNIHSPCFLQLISQSWGCLVGFLF